MAANSIVIDLTVVCKKYNGQWVALKDDEASVISHGKNIRAVLRAATDKGYEKPILFKVPATLTPMV